MRSRVVWTRVDENVLRELEREGVSPSEVSRKAIETAAARIRTQRVIGVLERKSFKSHESVVDIIRRLRDES